MKVGWIDPINPKFKQSPRMLHIEPFYKCNITLPRLLQTVTLPLSEQSEKPDATSWRAWLAGNSFSVYCVAHSATYWWTPKRLCWRYLQTLDGVLQLQVLGDLLIDLVPLLQHLPAKHQQILPSHTSLSRVRTRPGPTEPSETNWSFILAIIRTI